MIKIDNRLYYLDLNAIEEYVFKKDDAHSKPIVEEETIFDPDNHLVQKTVLKRDNHDDKFTQIRYDIVKSMLDTTYNSGVESEEGNITYISNMDENGIGAKLVFNTLLVNGFVKDKLD